jgi:hypothetical protein
MDKLTAVLPSLQSVTFEVRTQTPSSHPVHYVDCGWNLVVATMHAYSALKKIITLRIRHAENLHPHDMRDNASLRAARNNQLHWSNSMTGDAITSLYGLTELRTVEFTYQTFFKHRSSTYASDHDLFALPLDKEDITNVLPPKLEVLRVLHPHKYIAEWLDIVATKKSLDVLPCLRRVEVVVGVKVGIGYDGPNVRSALATGDIHQKLVAPGINIQIENDGV